MVTLTGKEYVESLVGLFFKRYYESDSRHVEDYTVVFDAWAHDTFGILGFSGSEATELAFNTSENLMLFVLKHPNIDI